MQRQLPYPNHTSITITPVLIAIINYQDQKFRGFREPSKRIFRRKANKSCEQGVNDQGLFEKMLRNVSGTRARQATLPCQGGELLVGGARGSPCSHGSEPHSSLSRPQRPNSPPEKEGSGEVATTLTLQYPLLSPSDPLLSVTEACLAVPASLPAFTEACLTPPDSSLAVAEPMLAVPDSLLAVAEACLTPPDSSLAVTEPTLAVPDLILAVPELTLTPVPFGCVRPNLL